jgi:hypothetical protein
VLAPELAGLVGEAVIVVFRPPVVDGQTAGAVELWEWSPGEGGLE